MRSGRFPNRSCSLLGDGKSNPLSGVAMVCGPPGTPFNFFCPSIFSAASPRCGRTLLGLLAALSAALPTVFTAVTVVVLASLLTTTAEGQGDPEPCSGGGYNPTPVEVEVTAVPIVVESTTADYFVLYVRHDLDGTEVEFPVLVKLGEAGTTMLSENVGALPADRYRVEKYLVADPADVDGDCIDDITELGDPVGMNPVNPAASVDLSDGALAVPDKQTYDTLAIYRTFKFILLGWDTDRPSLYFINAKQYPHHQTFLDERGIKRNQARLGLISYRSVGSEQVFYFSVLANPSFVLVDRVYTLLAASMPLLDDNLIFYIPNYQLPDLQSELPLYRESRIGLVFDEDIIHQGSFLALNPGEGYGRLQALEPDDRPHPRDIVIYEALPGERRRRGDHGLRVPDQWDEPLDLHRFHEHHPYPHRPRQRHGIHLPGAGGQQGRQGLCSQPSRGYAGSAGSVYPGLYAFRQWGWHHLRYTWCSARA